MLPCVCLVLPFCFSNSGFEYELPLKLLTSHNMTCLPLAGLACCHVLAWCCPSASQILLMTMSYNNGGYDRPILDLLSSRRASTLPQQRRMQNELQSARSRAAQHLWTHLRMSLCLVQHFRLQSHCDQQRQKPAACLAPSPAGLCRCQRRPLSMGLMMRRARTGLVYLGEPELVGVLLHEDVHL